VDDRSGFELSILEGVDEALLRRLHELGVRTRNDLEARIASQEGRRALARDVGVSPRRLQVIHHLNFLLPEERVERTLEIERTLLDRSDHVDHEFRQVWRAVSGISVAVLGAFFLTVFLSRSSRPPQAPSPDAERLARLEERVAALSPVAVGLADRRILEALAELGPTPGWNGLLTWNRDAHREIGSLLDAGPDHLPRRAVSLALLRLAELERAPLDSLPPLDRARAAAALAADFPPVPDPVSIWDQAAVLLRTRIRTRALGLAPVDSVSPSLKAASGWGWTSPGFLTCEELLDRLESLPVHEDALPVWSRTLVQIRSAADLGRERHQEAPLALARDYWLRRAELELAVVAALGKRPNLLPYHAASPREFLEQRLAFLVHVRDDASGRARTVLSWLAVEYEEALELQAWLDTDGAASSVAPGCWVETLAKVDAARRRNGMKPGPGVEREMRRVLGLDDAAPIPWSEPAVTREAALRPLLMETRAAAAAP
jgi:hypothetical protein